jgi:uncharacterized membrane protein YcaP (DUF421 family)
MWPDRAETCRSTCKYTINIMEVHLLEVIIYILMKMHGKHSIKKITLFSVVFHFMLTFGYRRLIILKAFVC